MNMNHETVDVVRVGDRIRFSVELIRQLADEAGVHTLVAEVVEIRRADDGTKTLVMDRAFPLP